MYKVINVSNNDWENDEAARPYRWGHVFEFEDYDEGYAFTDKLRTLQEDALDIAENDLLTTRRCLRLLTKWYNDCTSFIEEFGEPYLTADLRLRYNYIRTEKLYKPKVEFAPPAGRCVVAENEELYSRMHEHTLVEVGDVEYVAF